MPRNLRYYGEGRSFEAPTEPGGDVATKEALHRLIDELPDDDIAEAELLLRALQSDDPVLRAIALAPVDDEPETEEEAAAFREGLAALAEGRVIDDDDLRVGDWRVRYRYDPDPGTVTVVRVLPRGRAFRD